MNLRAESRAGGPEPAKRPAAVAPLAESLHKTPQEELRAAAVKGNARQAGRALMMGADPDHVYEDGRTALIKAALRGHTQVMKMLLGAGADARITDPDGYTAHGIARAARQHEAAELLGKKTCSEDTGCIDEPGIAGQRGEGAGRPAAAVPPDAHH